MKKRILLLALFVTVTISSCGQHNPTRSTDLWFACGDRGITRFDGQNWQIYTHEDFNMSGLHETLPASYSIEAIWQTADRALWAGSQSDGLTFRLDGTEWRGIEHYSLSGGYRYLGYPTRQGAVWFLSYYSDRVLRFDSAPGPRTYTHPRGLAGGYEAEDGSVWFHTGRGMTKLNFRETPDAAVRYQNSAWTQYTATDGFLDGQVFAMTKTSDGNLWYIGEHKGRAGLAHYNGKSWTLFTPQNGLIDHIFPPSQYGLFLPALLQTKDGALWLVGQHDGGAAVCQFDGNSWTRYTKTDGLVGTWANMGYQASDGTLWFSTVDNAHKGLGLFRFDGQTWQHHTEANGLSSDYITGIAEWPRGTLWVGTMHGISRLDLSAPAETALWWNKTDFAFAMPKVMSFVPTQRALWFAFISNRRGGVGRYDGKSWANFRMKDGLISDRVNSIYQASDGALWFTAKEGLTRFDGKNWRSYTESEGIRIEFEPALQENHDGSFWVDDSWGNVIHFKPDADSDTPETELASGVTRASSAGNVLLSWSGRDAWEKTPLTELQFQWRLDGSEWSAYSKRRDFTFTGLASGTHVFEVRTRTRNGIVDPTPASHSFLVEYAWWQNPYLIMPCLFLLSLVAAQTVRVVRRDRRLQESYSVLQNETEARNKLDAQLQHVQYLYRLRSNLSTTRTPQEAIEQTGKTLMEVLSTSASAGVRIQFDNKNHEFGHLAQENQTAYHRPLTWSGKERGHLHIFCDIALTEAQEHALLDETAGQLSNTLEARELEMQLLQSARLVSMGEMAAGVAHELNQPLSVISATAGDIYQRQLEGLNLPPDKLKAMMQNVLEVIERMDGTINHLRIFSRDTSQEPGIPVQINDVLHNSLKMIQAQLTNHNIDLRLELAEDLPVITGHPHQLEQVIVNLLANARDALENVTDREKQIAVKTWVEEREEMLEGDEKDALIVVLEIKDNGAGMSEEAQAHVFEPFFTTKDADKGTGLGLSISYSIVRNHNGIITCDSTRGEGTTFRLELPVCDENLLNGQ